MKCKEIRNIIVKFIHDEVGKTGRINVVIGISGGLDSSVVAKLAVDALGKDRVISILMPNKIDTCSKNYRDALELTKVFNIEHITIPVNYYLRSTSELDKSEHCCVDHKNNYVFSVPGWNCKLDDDYFLSRGNMVARMRMSILYDQAARRNAIVLGTTNKTELMLGYFTKYGDGGVDIEPIADLYKTEVFKLAKYINIPENIIKKPPSADLWPGQTDEEELGLKYEEIDQILWWLVEEDYDAVALELELEKLTGLTDKTIVNKALTLLDNNYHKRHMPSICKIGNIDIRTTMANNGKNGSAKRKH